MKTQKENLASRSGVTLVELLIALIIGAILMLMVGVLSQISIKTQRNYYSDLQIHADLSYGFKLLRKRIREFGYVTNPPVGQWLSEQIITGGGTFGVYQDDATNTKDFVYEFSSNREVILSVPMAETLTLTPTIIVDNKSITVRLQGTKNDIPFDMSSTVTKRGS